MRFALLGLAFGLSGFLLASGVSAAAVALVWRVRPPRSAAGLFSLRLLPSAVGAWFVLGLLLPAYLKHEPRHAVEPIGLALPLAMVAAAAFLTLAARRGTRSWLLTRRLLREWSRAGQPVELPGASLPAFALEHEFPVVAVVGIWRPRLFVAGQVLARLSPVQLAAVAAHEAGHVAARDNLRAVLMRCAPDWLSLTALGARLCAAWGAAAEREADDHAVRTAADPVELAAALVAVARLVPPGMRLALPVSAFHDGEDELQPRVVRLLARADGGKVPVRVGRPAWWLVGALGALSLAVAAHPGTLAAVHAASEVGLRLLRF